MDSTLSAITLSTTTLSTLLGTIRPRVISPVMPCDLVSGSKMNYGLNELQLSLIPTMLQIGLQPWTFIFQFRRTKSRIQSDNIFWFISLLSTTRKKFPKINLHDSELMTYVHVHGRQLQKLLLHIQYYH